MHRPTLSLVFFSVHDILCFFLHIHISHALIFFHFLCHCPRLTAIQNCWENYCSHYPFFVSMLMCLSRHNFSNPIIVAFPIASLRFISLSHLPSFSTSDPRNVKLVSTSISSPSISKLSQLAVVIIFVFFMLKYRPGFSLSLFSLLISFARSAFFPAINVVSSAYLKLFSVLPAIFTPSFASSISAFLILSAYRLNKNGDKMQPCRTPFLILNLSVSPNSVLITGDWSSYNPLSSCIRCFGIPISSKVFHNSS